MLFAILSSSSLNFFVTRICKSRSYGIRINVLQFIINLFCMTLNKTSSTFLSVVKMAKATMIAKGRKKYEAKIKALGGAAAYRTCGAKGGMDVAICLKGLKVALTEADWAKAWETAMS